MKWKLTKPWQRDKEDEQQTTTKIMKKKTSTSSNSSPSSSSSSSSSFSISHLLPLSWFASRLKTSKRTSTPHYRSTAIVCSSCPSPPPSPAVPRRLREPIPRHSSASSQFVFRHSDRVPARFPHRIGAADVPSRRSLGDDDPSRPHRTDDAKAVPRRRRWHHLSPSDLDLTLGHLISLSVRPRAIESDSERDESSSGGQCPPKQRKRRRKIVKAAPPSDIDSRDSVLPRRSFGKKMQRCRARVKVHASSPRTPTPASRRRRRRRRAENAAKATRKLEGFAVVKRSRDPQRDFRESMMEMIWAKGMRRPEELENLLACYLSVNVHEHHDVIVKVFRQLWFELDPDRFSGSSY